MGKDQEKTKKDLLEELNILQSENHLLKSELRTCQLDIQEQKKASEWQELLFSLFINNELSAKDILNKIAEITPQYLRAVISVGIGFQNKHYQTAGFTSSAYSIKKEIFIKEKPTGYIEFYFPENSGASFPNSYRQEEVMLETLAKRTGTYFQNKLEHERLIQNIRERESAEKKLLKSKESYRNLVENINDAIFETDVNGTIRFISAQIEQIIGYCPGEMIGCPIFQFLDTDPDFFKNRFSLLQKELRLKSTYEVSTKSGEKRWIRISSKAIVRNKKFIGAFGTIIDISEKKRMEFELRRSEENYKTLFYDSPDGYLIYQDGIFVECNEATEKLLRGNRSQILGRSLLQLSPEYQYNGKRTDDYAKEIFEEVMRTGRKSVEWIHQRFDGTECTAQVDLTKTQYMGEQAVLAIWRDITARKKAEEQVLKLSLAVEQSPVSIIITNTEGSIEYANPKACETSGYTHDELIGKNPRILKSGEMQNAEYKYLWETISKGEIWHGVFHNKKKNGEYYWESAQITPIKNEFGQVLGYSAVKEDISLQKMMQEALQESEKMLNYAQKMAKMCSWEYEIAQNKIKCSQNYFKLFEISEDEENLTFDSLKRKVHPEDRPLLEKKIKELVLRKKTLRIEHRLLMSDGRIKWIETQIVPELDDKNNLKILKGINLDITEKKLAQEELTKRERDLNTAQRLAQISNWEYDLRSGITKWSENTYEIYKVDTSLSPSFEFLYKNRIHPEDTWMFDNMIKSLTENPTEIKFDYRIILPGKEIRWLHNEVVPVLKEDQLILVKGINQDITEKKKTEIALKNQNDRLNAALLAIPDLIFVISRDGIYLESYTTRTEELLLIPDKLIGSSIYDTFPKEKAAFHIEKIRQCLLQKKLITYNYSISKNNEESYFEARISPVDENKVLILARNITEKRTQELQVTRLSLAVKQSPVITIITDLTARIEYANPAFERITGYKLEEVLGKNVRLLQSGKTPRPVYDDLWKTIRAGKIWHGEWMNKRKNGKLYWEEVIITPIFNEDNRQINFLAVKQDITERKKTEKEIADLNSNLEQRIIERTNELEEINSRLLNEIEVRKQAEQALALSEEKYRSVVENIREIIFITDIKGNWTFLNGAWEEVTGFRASESIGKKFIQYVHPEDQAHALKLFHTLSNKGEQYFRQEVRYLTRDGGFKWIEVYAKPAIDEKNNVMGIYGTLQDISERKRATEFENVLLQLSAQLTGLSMVEIDSALDMALGRIGRFLDADRSYIFEFSNSGETMSMTREWCNDGITSGKNYFQKVSTSDLPFWMKKLHKHENIFISSLSAVPGTWRDELRIFEYQNIKSLLAIPMLVENRLIGFVGLSSIRHEKEYSIAEVNVLQVWSGILASLTKNKHTEGLLAEARQNYETFFNTIDDFLFVFEESGKIVDTNNTVLKRLGYTKKEILGLTILDIKQDRREESATAISKMLSGGANYCFVPLVTKTGEQIPVETRVTKGFWNGKPVLFGVSKDISQIKLSEQKFSSAFQISSAMMSIARIKDGRFIDVNQAVIDISGYSKKEIIGKTGEELGFYVNPEVKKLIFEKIDKNEPINKIEIEFRAKNNSTKTGLISAKVIYIGSEKCLLTVIIDITDRKNAEEKMLKAQAEAEKANAAKSEFLSRMSHELRTPMNSILGFAQLLEMGKLDASQKKGIEHILKSGKHLLNLINEVLDISRIEAGRLSLSMEPVPVAEAILEMIDVIRPQAHDKNISVRFINDRNDNVLIKADKQKFKQVFLNLLNNSIKYNYEGGTVVINIEVIPANSQNHAMVRISIADSGPGIRKEDLNKLFNPFERIGADRTNIEGTGLGLTVVKKLVGVMDGKTGVESILGKGSTFWVEFPFVTSQAEDNKLIEPPAELVHILEEKNGVILYIEDNLSNIDLIKQIFANQQSHIQLISSMFGKQALTMAIENTPDLILLDLNLPDINGIDVLKNLKINKKTRSIPVVIISADAMPQQLERLKKAGAESYLTKPIDIREFLSIINKFLSH